VFPLTNTKKLTEDKRNQYLKRAFDNNSILFSSRICAAPVVVKDLVKKIWPGDNDMDETQKLLSLSLDSKKLKSTLQDGIKDMEFRNDLMDFVDSSEGEHNDLIYNLDDPDEASSESKFGFIKKKMESKVTSLENSKDSIDFSQPSQVSSQQYDPKVGFQR